MRAVLAARTVKVLMECLCSAMFDACLCLFVALVYTWLVCVYSNSGTLYVLQLYCTRRDMAILCSDL